MQKAQRFQLAVFPAGVQDVTVVRTYVVIGSKATAITQAQAAFRQATGTPTNVALDYFVKPVVSGLGEAVESSVPARTSKAFKRSKARA